MSLMFDRSSLVRALKSVLGCYFDFVFCFTLMLVRERLSRFRFDGFEFRKSAILYFILMLARERLCHVAWTNPLLDLFGFVFDFLTLKLSCGSDCPFLFWLVVHINRLLVF